MNILSAIAWPFKKIFGGIKQVPESFMSVLGGMEVIGTVIIETFPEEFIDQALMKVAALDSGSMAGKEKRADFLGWAKVELNIRKISWKERIIRALLEILLSRLRS
jgi:hypothetical protein